MPQQPSPSHPSTQTSNTHIDSPSIEIARLQSFDYERVVDLFRHLGPNYCCDPDDQKTKDTFNVYLNDPRKHGLVARCGASIAGVILYEITPVLSLRHQHGRNDGIVVDPEYRGRGIAKKLIRAVLEHCRSVDATVYMVKASDPHAISLYRNMPELQERGVYFYAT